MWGVPPQPHYPSSSDDGTVRVHEKQDILYGLQKGISWEGGYLFDSLYPPSPPHHSPCSSWDMEDLEPG